MTKFHQIELELVRPGPAHNQLLSPLTRYMALCGESSPITFSIHLEHHQLLSRLERLRYVTPGKVGGIAVPDRMREATVSEVGEDVAQIFRNFNSLLAEEWRAIGTAVSGNSGSKGQLVNLRLVVSGSELSYVPFEMAIAPEAFPGEGREFFLDAQMPVVLTREIRRTRALPVAWDRDIEPKVLLIAASPHGDIPLKEHVFALRSSLEPWIRWPKREEGESKEERLKKRLKYVKYKMRILQDASVESIYEICSKEQFTHVHILAHGGQMEIGGETRYGLVLCKNGQPGKADIVSGKRLAEAMQAVDESGTRRSEPVLVTLATCDSGSTGSVLVPGGSIAHDLHVAGIPWVIASQFPLTKTGSFKMAKAFYPRLFRGDDPRDALFEVRRTLHMTSERDHDWASLVAYASIPQDFEDQVYTFFEEQTKRAIEVALGRADYVKETDNEEDLEERQTALNDAHSTLETWNKRLPTDESAKSRSRRAEHYGMCGSTFKRIGLQLYERGKNKEGRLMLEKSLNFYLRGVEEWSMDKSKYHWVATQALSLKAVLKAGPETATFLMARQLAERDLEASSKEERAWANGTLAELRMLEAYHDSKSFNERTTLRDVKRHCKEIVRLTDENSFPTNSTRRQFLRYVNFWPNQKWNETAKAAVAALSFKQKTP